MATSVGGQPWQGSTVAAVLADAAFELGAIAALAYPRTRPLAALAGV